MGTLSLSREMLSFCPGHDVKLTVRTGTRGIHGEKTKKSGEHEHAAIFYTSTFAQPSSTQDPGPTSAVLRASTAGARLEHGGGPAPWLAALRSPLNTERSGRLNLECVHGFGDRTTIGQRGIQSCSSSRSLARLGLAKALGWAQGLKSPSDEKDQGSKKKKSSRRKL